MVVRPDDRPGSALVTRITRALASSPARPHWAGRIRRIRPHMVAVRCPQDFAHILQRAGGMWEPGSRRWLVTRHRIGPVIRALERETDPLFRQAGMSLD
jgi:hypothetical protein